jgi:RNA polymerase sigma-70 factor (ECF subfamily)
MAPRGNAAWPGAVRRQRVLFRSKQESDMPHRAAPFTRHIRDARAGSKEALGQLLEDCRPYLLLIANEELDTDLQAKGGASDLVQDSFLEAQQSFARFRGTTEAELLGWLRQILRNNLANFTRRYRATAKRRAAVELPLTGHDRSGYQGLEYDLSTGSTPSERVMAQERAAAVQQALGRLPEDYRQILLLRYQEQLSFEEIGHRLARSGNAAEKLFARAVRCMRRELEAAP